MAWWKYRAWCWRQGSDCCRKEPEGNCCNRCCNLCRMADVGSSRGKPWNVKDTACNVVDGLQETVSETKSVLGSLGNTLQVIGSSLGNLLGGGLNMFSNFFSNLTNGKISGLGIGGLIAAGYLMFGRSGLLGKIGGALLAMMMISGNSRQQAPAVAQENTQQQSQEQQHGMRR